MKLKEGAKPKHVKTYPVPKTYEQVTTKETRRFCETRVFKEENYSEWVALIFIQSQKMGDMLVFAGFIKLNKALVCKPCPFA